MATIFSLAAECGPDRSVAEAVAAHFERIAPVLDDGKRYECDVWVSQDDEGAWWAVCHPKGFYTGSHGNEPILTPLGFALFERLKTAPPYRFADCGMEAEHCRTYDDIDGFMVEYSDRFDGFVISDEIWTRLGSPAQYVPFSVGYHWMPFVCAK